MVEALKVKVEALAQAALGNFNRVTRLNDLAKLKRKTTIRSPKKGRQAASKAHAKRGKAPAEPLRTEELESCSLEAEESTKLELELELIQTHMAQKPMLRVEVGALGAHQVKNMRGRAG